MSQRWQVTNKANKRKVENTNLQIQIQSQGNKYETKQVSKYKYKTKLICKYKYKTEGANTNQGGAAGKKSSSSYIGAVAQWGANLA